MLRTESISKSYTNRDVVNKVSMCVRPGQVVGLLGPNGAGKTTCFYMIVGLIPVDSGTILVDDQDVTHEPVNIRSLMGVGYLPQDASIFRKLSVAQNIMAILELRKDLDQAGREENLMLLMEDLGVSHLANQSGISLSGGERRRVEIARALAAKPRFILLDEPFAGVDPISVGDIQQIIRHLKNRGIGVLITDHNVRETLGICEKAYIVSEGHIIAEGNAAEVLNNSKVRKVYLGDHFTL